MTQAKTKHTDVDKESLRLEYCFEKGINFKDRVLQITGPIEEHVSFDYLDAALTEMERGSKKSITIKINSPGGSTYEALAMVDRIRESKCQIVTKCYGHAMSAASIILAAGDKRLIGRRAWLMHHEISYGSAGTLSEHVDLVTQTHQEFLQWCKAMAEFTNMPYEFWLEEAKKKDAYFNAEEALELGIADAII